VGTVYGVESASPVEQLAEITRGYARCSATTARTSFSADASRCRQSDPPIAGDEPLKSPCSVRWRGLRRRLSRFTPPGDFSHFPAFMPDVEEVTVTGPTTSHWKVSAPLGKSVEWDAEITEDVPNQRIAWKSIGDIQVDNAGGGALRRPWRPHQHRGVAGGQPARVSGWWDRW
jgi:hypothetical protein